MSGGSLYRALARNQYLQPVVDAFHAIQQQNRHEQWIKDMQDAYSKYQSGLNNINTATQPQTTQVANPNYQTYADATTPQIQNPAQNALTFDPTKPMGNNPVNPEPNNNFNGVLAPTFPKTTNVPLSEVQKYNRARKLSEDTMMGLFSNTNAEFANPAQINFLSKLLDQGTEQFKPDVTEYKSVPAGGLAGFSTKTGKPTGENIKGNQAAKYTFKTQTLDDGTLQDYKIDENTNDKIPVGKPYKDTKADREQANKDRDFQLNKDKFLKDKLDTEDPDVIQQNIALIDDQLQGVHRSTQGALYNNLTTQRLKLQQTLNKVQAKRNKSKTKNSNTGQNVINSLIQNGVPKDVAEKTVRERHPEYFK